jgi:large repetitive protein
LDASGSTNAVSYEWNDGSTGSTLEVSEPGTYSVTVTAANGCTASKTVTVGQDINDPVASITPDDGILTCTVTSIVLDASGSTNAVSYEWNDGSTGSTLEVSEPGTYSVTVTAANGCTASKTVTVGQDINDPVASITPEDGVLTCTVTSIVLDASGSTNAVSYEWNDGSTGSTLEVSEPGTYSVTVTAANGCTASKTVTVGQDINDPVASITPDDGILTCTVTSIVLDASGSTNAVSYEWNDGSTGSTLEVTEPGDYTVTVTAANGCTASKTVTVGQDETLPVASITPDDGILTCTVTSIVLDASGSTNAVSYEWNDGSTGSTLEVSEPGTYSVTVTAANGCTASKTVTVGQDETLPVASITPEDGVLTCTVGSITLDASGSTNAVSYEWNDGSTGSTLEVNEPGTYSVTVTAANGCTASKTVTVGQDETLPVASITPEDGILTCTVTSIVLDASGSTNAVSYEWNDGSTGSTLEVSEPGTYSVTVTAANGCTASKTVTVGQDINDPVASITPDDGVLTCTVTSITLDASGSTNAVSYEWNDGSTGSTLEVTEPGDYTVTVTAANGCTDIATVTVGQDETLPALSLMSKTCSPDFQTYDIVFESNGTIISTAGTVDNTAKTVTGIPSGTDVTLTAELENGCTTELQVTAPECGCPEIEITSVTSYPNEPVEINSPVELTVNYSSSAPVDITIIWDEGVTESFPDETYGIVTATHSYPSPGVYTVTVEATNECGNTATEIYEYIVVYDPDGGFVTGGGWFMSPPGAYLPDESITGKASFGFVAKYQKGRSKPSGHTEFQFRAANLNFNSTDYEWLVVSSDKKAQFQGTGTINGLPEIMVLEYLLLMEVKKHLTSCA